MYCGSCSQAYNGSLAELEITFESKIGPYAVLTYFPIAPKQAWVYLGRYNLLAHGWGIAVRSRSDYPAFSRRMADLKKESRYGNEQ